MSDFKQQLQEKIKADQDLLDLIEKYDLKEYSGRWNKFYYTDQLNHLMTDIEIGASCGCCSDAVVYARAYFVEKGVRIYAHPVNMEIGQQNSWGMGVISCEYNANHLSDELQQRIRKYLEENLPEDFEDDE